VEFLFSTSNYYKFQLCRLKDTGYFERAACISIFHNDFDKAIDILTLASKISKKI
jgi:hypothetical protein